MNTDLNSPPTETTTSLPIANEKPHDILKRPTVGRYLKIFLFLVFGWIFVGISFIIGVRMWWNSPIHPSFAMFGAVAFASVIAFTIVLSLDIVTGSNLAFEFAGLKFTGTSGPVTLWILTFLAIMSTFILGDFKTLSTSDASPKPPLQNLASSSSNDESKLSESTARLNKPATIQALLQRGDAAVFSGDLAEARRLYNQARQASRRLLEFYPGSPKSLSR